MNEFEEKVFEVEKARVVNGKEVFAKEYLIPAEDGPAWFESRTGRSLNSLEELNLPVGWRWSSNWKVTAEDRADNEGWVREGQVRRRKWARKREKMSSASQSSVSTPKALPTTPVSSQSLGGRASGSVSGNLDERGIMRVVSEALQRLDASIQKITMASDRVTIDRLSKEGREAVNEGQAALSQLASFEKPTTRAARIKLSNDFLRDQERLQRVVREALMRAPARGAETNLTRRTSAPTNKNTMDVSQMDEHEALARRDMLERQRQELLQMEKVHRQVLSNEIQSDAALIEERHKELLSVQSQVQAVNQAMQQVSQLLGEQDHSVKTLVATTTKANENLEKGLSEVKKAEQYQQEGGCIIS